VAGRGQMAWLARQRELGARAVVSRTGLWSWSVRVFDQNGKRWGPVGMFSMKVGDYEMVGPRRLVEWRARRKVREIVRLVELRRETFTVRP
jgi:hypothetical protein